MSDWTETLGAVVVGVGALVLYVAFALLPIVGMVAATVWTLRWMGVIS